MSLIKKNIIALSTILLCLSQSVLADDFDQTNLTITKLRAVGDYSAAELYDNTVEVHFSPSVTWPNGSACTVGSVVAVAKADQHIVSAAYMAFAAGKKINIHVDTRLPVRLGVCQVSFIDVLN